MEEQATGSYLHSRQQAQASAGPTVSHVAVVIPAYRPASTLLDVITRVLSGDSNNFISFIVVVDDGSGHEFNEIFQSIQFDERVRLVRHAINLGKGAALKTGFNYALTTWPDIHGIVTADADGQHAPSDILNVAQMLAEHSEQIVIGVRRFARSAPLRSHLGNTLTRHVFHTFTGVQLADTQTGLRGWPRRYCENCLRIAINGYDFELECLLRARHFSGNGRPFFEVPIETIYLDDNRSSHFNPIRDSMRIYFVFLRYCGSSLFAAVVDSLTFYLLFHSSGNMVLGQAVGRAFAVMIAFFLARNVVFKASGGVAPTLARYLGLVIVMGVVSYAMIQYLHTRVGLGVLPSKLLAEGLLFLGNFAVQRDFIFVKKGRAGRTE